MIPRLLALLAAAAFALPSPAWGHSGSNASENLRTEVIAVPAGLEVQVHSDGSLITVRAAVEVRVSASPDAAAFTIAAGSGWYPWHDDRMIWEGDRLPAAVMADPSRAHPVATWSIPVTVGGLATAITGRTVWVPPAGGAGFTAVILLGLLGLALSLAAWAAFPRRAR